MLIMPIGLKFRESFKGEIQEHKKKQTFSRRCVAPLRPQPLSCVDQRQIWNAIDPTQIMEVQERINTMAY